MITAKKVLIADDMHDSIIPQMRELGYDPIYKPEIKRAEILTEINDCFGLIIRSKTSVDKEVIDYAPNLKFVARAGSGMDKVDINYLESRDIVAVNAPEGNRDSLGEHTLGLLLGLLHRINHGHQQIANLTWDREGNRGIELRKKTVGIYGVGNMGMSFAKKLRGLDCRVVGYDVNSGYGNEYIEELSIEEFKTQTEILSIHIPLYENTKYLFNKAYLREFSKLKVVINTARGKIVKTSSLIELLSENVLYGVALDVLENEKIEQYTSEQKEELDELLSFPNVIVTPHVAGWTYESYERINRVICAKLKEHFH